MRVLNKHRDGIPDGAVYIGRGSKWGNPFVMGRDGTRQEVVEKYCHYLIKSGLANSLHELVGRDLVCFCAPKLCHGDAIVELIAMLLEEDDTE